LSNTRVISCGNRSTSPADGSNESLNEGQAIEYEEVSIFNRDIFALDITAACLQAEHQQAI
jgi:hypothetical protein